MTKTDPSLVRNLPFFQGIGDDDLRAVLQVATTRRLTKRATVFEQGQPAKEFFVLLSGHLKVVQTTPDGREVIVRIVEPGEPYGIAMALGRWDYPATAVAMQESLTLAWPSSSWVTLVERIPLLATNALKMLGRRVQDAHTQVREVSTEDVEHRVAHLLLRIAKQNASAADETADVEFPITRQDIAAMTGTTLFTVSRILSSWESQGIVAGGRERISLRQPAKLREIAERD